MSKRFPAMNRMVLAVVLVLVLWAGGIWFGVAGGRSREQGRWSWRVAVVARRQRLAELDVSAAAVKLLAGNVWRERRRSERRLCAGAVVYGGRGVEVGSSGGLSSLACSGARLEAWSATQGGFSVRSSQGCFGQL